jgi:lipopolysaccharide transport system permease protein
MSESELILSGAPAAAPAEPPAPVGRPCLVLRPQSGWATLDLCELWRYRDLLLILGLRDVKLRYRQTVLGVAWVVLQPLLAAGIFAFVFGAVAKLPSAGLPYFLFAYAGLLGWTAFQGTITKASTCLVQSANLISKVYFPRLILPLSTLFSTAVDSAVGLVLLLALLPIWAHPGPEILLLPVWFGLLLLMAMGLGLLAGALMVPYRDVQYILPVLIQLGMYASPVAYGVAAVPERLRPVVLLNPLSGLMEALRWSLLGASQPDWGAVAYGAGFAAVAFIAGAYSFKRMERNFADVI